MTRANRLVIALVFGASLVIGCAESPAPVYESGLTIPCGESEYRISDTTIMTAGGISATIPAWLWNQAQDLIPEALEEIDTSGCPRDWSVVIEAPHFASITACGVLLCRGICDYDRQVLRVGWRLPGYENRPLLPALGHEVGHIYFGPTAGH